MQRWPLLDDYVDIYLIAVGLMQAELRPSFVAIADFTLICSIWIIVFEVEASLMRGKLEACNDQLLFILLFIYI
jgi:hypothetical protein